GGNVYVVDCACAASVDERRPQNVVKFNLMVARALVDLEKIVGIQILDADVRGPGSAKQLVLSQNVLPKHTVIAGGGVDRHRVHPQRYAVELIEEDFKRREVADARRDFVKARIVQMVGVYGDVVGGGKPFEDEMIEVRETDIGCDLLAGSKNAHKGIVGEEA